MSDRSWNVRGWQFAPPRDRDPTHDLLIEAIERSASLFSKRWKPSIIFVLKAGPHR